MWFPRGRTVESGKLISIRRKRPEDSVHLRCGIATRSGGGPDGIVIRSLGVVDAFSQSRASRVPTGRRHRVAAVQFHVLLNRPPVVFSPIAAPVLAHIVEVRPGAHDGIPSDIAPSPKSATNGNDSSARTT